MRFLFILALLILALATLIYVSPVVGLTVLVILLFLPWGVY